MGDQLWGVLIGGLLAIVGGTFAPWLQHKLARRDKIEDDRRQRLHDLIGSVYEHQQWIEVQRRAKMFGDEEPLGPDPIGRIHAYVYSDFPDQVPQYHRFRVAAAAYSKWATARMGERIKGEELDIEDYQNVFEAYTLASGNLLSAATGHAVLTHDQVFGSAEGDQGSSLARK